MYYYGLPHHKKKKRKRKNIMNLLPNNSSKITFIVLIGFLLLGVYFLIQGDPESGWPVIAIGLTPMLLLLGVNYFKSIKK